MRLVFSFGQYSKELALTEEIKIILLEGGNFVTGGENTSLVQTVGSIPTEP